MEEKDDEGRTFVQIYDKKIVADIEDAYEAEAEHADAMDDNVLCRDKKQTKMTGYNVFVKEKFAEISGEHKELSNAEIMRLVAGRWKNMSKEDQRPYLDLADQRNAPENVSAPGNAPGNTLGNVPDAPAMYRRAKF